MYLTYRKLPFYFLLLQGYTNADNPFGDEHLLQTFVWNKKLQKEGLADVERHAIDKMQQRKMIENKVDWVLM